MVLAGGVASVRLANEFGVRLPVRPIKGETLSVATRTAPIEANVWDDNCYLVPKFEI